jgi:2,4-dienoyl-CoA reductase (NADPH2)
VAAAAPHRATLVDIVDHLSREMRRLRVDVNLGAGIEDDDVAEILGMADHVVVATGSAAPAAPPELGERPSASVDDVLRGAVPELDGKHALVYDEDDGFWPAYSAAESLARRGWSVTLATPLTALASRIPAESVGPLLARLAAAGVQLEVGRRLVVPSDPAAPTRLRPVFGGDDVELPASLTVWHRPRVAVLPAGIAPGPNVSVVGDCVTPRRIGHAIAEGYRAGAEIGAAVLTSP